MSRSSWPDGKVSIVLLPSGSQGEDLLDLAREWTRMGLLGPALWVRPEQVQRARSGPPRIGATVLVLDLEQRLRDLELDLFESLARESLSLVRLVKLRSAAPSREIDAEQDEIAEHVGEYLSKSMPMAVPTASITDQVTELTRLTLICAPTEFQLQQRVDWAASEYGTVVVASPEDRSSPWSGDAFVRDNERFTGFALMHVASVAGLWSGTGVGSFELIPREASSSQSVWVSRVFLNAVITEALGRRTAAQVLDLAAQADSLLIDPSAGSPPTGTSFIDDADVPVYVENMVEASMSLDDGALSFHPIIDEEEPGRGRLSIGEQLRSFGAFSVDKVAAMPKWTWRWLTSRAARSLTKQLQSADGTHVVGEDYDAVVDARDAQLILRRDEIFAAETAARETMSAPVGVSAMRTTPRLWARLRELVFGALDGSSDLSELGFAPIEGKVPVFGRVSDVFPHPDDVWSVSEGLVELGGKVDWYTLAQEDPRPGLVRWTDEARLASAHADGEAAKALQDLDRLRAAEAVAAAAPEPAAPEPAAPQHAESAPEGTVPDATAQKATAPPAAVGSGHDLPTHVVGEASGAETGDAADESDLPDAEAAADDDAAHDAGTTQTPPTPPEPPVPPAPPIPQTPVVDHAAAQAQRAQARAEAEGRTRVAAANAEAVRTEMQRRENILADYDTWAMTKDRSFTWRLLMRLAEHRAGALEAVQRYDDEINRLQVPAPGELLRLRRSFHRGVLMSLALIALAAFVLFIPPLVVSRFYEQVAEHDLWYPEGWLIIVAALGAFLIVLSALLAAYHRGWSAFQRRVDVTHAHLSFISAASRSARSEATRLTSLHRQTVDWVDLLARAVHQPWQIRQEWLNKPDYDVARAAMPFAMTIGTVVESDYAATTRLRRMTTERLVRRGWRAEAFRDLVREVGALLGQDGDAFGVAALDDDLPHSSNNTRRMLRENMTHGDVLTRVAAPRLRDLVVDVQQRTLQGSKPKVASIEENPLRALSAMTDPAGIEDDSTAWDEFLLGTLVGRREPVTPLSTSWLTQRQVQEGHHELVTSYLVLPERLERQLDFRDDAAVSLTPFAGAGRASIDLVWRSDVVGPLPIGAIGLWSPPTGAIAVEVDPEQYDSGI